MANTMIVVSQTIQSRKLVTMNIMVSNAAIADRSGKLPIDNGILKGL